MFNGNCFIIFVDPGACNMFISHPLDTVKTNMQSGNMRFLPAAKVLLKTEGVSRRPLIYTMLIPCRTLFVPQLKARAYYRGLLFPLCSTGFLNSVIFGVYGNSFRMYQDM